MLFMIIGYTKIVGNYYYNNYIKNLKQCVKREEEGMLFISRAKLSEAQG